MSRRLIHLIILLSAATGCALGQSPGTFTATGSMATPRSYHTATLLADGRVLITGGTNIGAGPPEIYDPSTGAFTVIGGVSTLRYMDSLTLLPDGRVLIIGGASAELYDPALDFFVTTGNLTYPGGDHSAILLLNGKVLILGSDAAEIYDPDTGTFTPTGLYVGPGCNCWAPTMRLADGRVLSTQQYQPQLYDPATGTFSPTGSMLAGMIDGAADTLLMSGKVLFAGGGSEDDVPQSDAELYDPGTGVVSSTGHMLLGRRRHTLTLLPDGKVLAAGGETGMCSRSGCYNFPATGATAELYDPTSGAFSATGNMTAAREGHTATLLNDGRVLLTGGEAWGGSAVYYVPTASAEVYTPEVLVPLTRLTSLSPSWTVAGDTGFTLTVNGSNFSSGAVVQWNGNPLATTFVSTGILTAPVSNALIASAGTVSITVFSAGQISNSIAFRVSNPIFTALAITNQRVTTQAPLLRGASCHRLSPPS